MKKKVVKDIVFGVILAAFIFLILFGVKYMHDTWQNKTETIEANKPITAYLMEDNKKEIVKTSENYIDSIENINYIIYDKNSILNYVICVDEGYEDVTVSLYVSDEGLWKVIGVKNMGKGQYLMNFIKEDDVKDRTVSCCIKASNSEGTIESYFSYKPVLDERGVGYPY